MAELARGQLAGTTNLVGVHPESPRDLAVRQGVVCDGRAPVEHRPLQLGQPTRTLAGHGDRHACSGREQVRLGFGIFVIVIVMV